MHDALRPRRRACARASRLRAAARAGRARGCRRARARAGEHLVAEAGTGTGKSLAYLLPALESGQRVVVATATKALQEQLLAKDVPAPRARSGARSTSPCSRGARTTSAASSSQSFGPMLLRDPRDEEASRRCSPGSPRPRPATAPSCRRAVRGALGGARRRRRPLRRPTLPARLELLCGGGEGARRRGRARDREPRAVLRRPRRGRRGAARARRGRLRRGAPARGDRRDVARRPHLARRASPARARRRARLPRGRRAVPRRGRSIASSAPATGCCARSPRRRGAGGCARLPAEPALVLVDALAALAEAARGRGEGLDAALAAHARDGRAGRGVPRARRARARRLGRARRARLGARRRLGRAARAALGRRAHRDPRLGDAHDRRGRELRPPPARARRTRASSSSARRSTTASRRSSTSRARCPTRAARVSPSAPPRRSLAALALARVARSC